MLIKEQHSPSCLDCIHFILHMPTTAQKYRFFSEGKDTCKYNTSFIIQVCCVQHFQFLFLHLPIQPIINPTFCYNTQKILIYIYVYKSIFKRSLHLHVLMYGIPGLYRCFSPIHIKNNLIKNTGKKIQIKQQTETTTGHGLNYSYKKKSNQS